MTVTASVLPSWKAAGTRLFAVAGIAMVARLELEPPGGLLKMRTAQSAKPELIANGKANGHSIKVSTRSRGSHLSTDYLPSAD